MIAFQLIQLEKKHEKIHGIFVSDFNDYIYHRLGDCRCSYSESQL